MQTQEKEFWNPYVAGIALGVVLVVSYLLIGMGVGSSSAPTRLSFYLLHMVAPGYVEANGYMGKYFVGPDSIFYDRLFFLVLGTFLGALVAAYSAGRSKIEMLHGPNATKAKRILFAILGGFIMGFAARLARGCTSGQALNGGTLLSVGSWLFMIMMFVGGYLIAPFVRRLWK